MNSFHIENLLCLGSLYGLYVCWWIANPNNRTLNTTFHYRFLQTNSSAFGHWLFFVSKFGLNGPHSLHPTNVSWVYYSVLSVAQISWICKYIGNVMSNYVSVSLTMQIFHQVTRSDLLSAMFDRIPDLLTYLISRRHLRSPFRKNNIFVYSHFRRLHPLIATSKSILNTMDKIRVLLPSVLQQPGPVDAASLMPKVAVISSNFKVNLLNTNQNVSFYLFP